MKSSLCKCRALDSARVFKTDSHSWLSLGSAERDTAETHTYILYIHNYTHTIRQYTLDIIRSWVWELKTPKVTEWRITELIPMDGASPADKNLWHEAQWNGAPWLWREQLKKTMRTVLRTWRTLYLLYDYCIHAYNVYIGMILEKNLSRGEPYFFFQ